MKKILLLNPGISTFNRGDEIIAEGVKEHLAPVLAGNFITEVSTHSPINLIYINHLRKYDAKFVCGSNLLMGKLGGLFRQWEIGIKTIPAYKNCVLVGAGWRKYNEGPSLYAKFIYNQILSKVWLHSVRDEYTKRKLESMGITNVINTGCASMWNLTPKFCHSIPKEKSNTVVFTLTDYNKDIEADKQLIQILKKCYKRVCFWIQGEGDADYLRDLNSADGIEIIESTVASFNHFLDENHCDYVGTRLHGGIRAMQKRRRTIIIAIDNRAIEMERDFNIPCVNRTNLAALEQLLFCENTTDIKLPLAAIHRWKGQFT